MGKRKSPQKGPSPTALQRERSQVKERGWVDVVLTSRGLIVLFLLLAAVLWYGYYSVHIPGVLGSDDREYASIGRNIVQGKGVVRNFVFPIEVQSFGHLPMPEFIHPPGYPLILAGFYKLFGVSEAAALLPSYLSYFFLVGLFFYLARKRLDTRKAIIATLILVFNREILELSLVALSEAVYTPLFFLSFLVMVEAKSLKVIFVAGLLVGAGHLIRQDIYPFLPPLLVYLYLYPELPRWKKILFFFIGFAIPIAPELLRSLRATGSPFFSYGRFALMAFTEKYPWLDIYRNIEIPSFFRFLAEDGDQFLAKYIGNLMTAFKEIPVVSSPVLFAFFFISLFSWRIDPFWKRAKMLFLLLFVFQIFFVSLLTFTGRYFVPFLPLMILFAVEGFFTFAESVLALLQSRWNRRILALLVPVFVIVSILPALSVLFYANSASSLHPKNAPFGFLISREDAEDLNRFLRAQVKEDQVVWTDLPEVLEWEGNRLCGWLPRQVGDIYQIDKRIPVDAILLTSLRTPRQMEAEWVNLFSHEQGLPRYGNVRFFKGKNLSAKLLIRDRRE